MKLTYTETAKETIASLPPEIKKDIRDALESLALNPYLGKPLLRELAEFWSLPVKRYRVIYELAPDGSKLLVHAVGHRRGIYEQASTIKK